MDKDWTEEAARLHKQILGTLHAETEIALIAAALAKRDEKIAGLLKSLDAHDGFIAELKAERDAAVVQGLEIAGPYLDGIIKSAKYCHTAIMNRIGDPKPDMILLENISIDHLEYVERIKIMIAAEIAKRKAKPEGE